MIDKDTKVKDLFFLNEKYNEIQEFYKQQQFPHCDLCGILCRDYNNSCQPNYKLPQFCKWICCHCCKTQLIKGNSFSLIHCELCAIREQIDIIKQKQIVIGNSAFNELNAEFEKLDFPPCSICSYRCADFGERCAPGYKVKDSQWICCFCVKKSSQQNWNQKNEKHCRLCILRELLSEKDD